MKSFDILEELGNLDDEILIHAQEDPPPKQVVWLRAFRSAAAACLICMLAFTALLATDVIAFESGLRWTVRYREDYVIYLFKGGTEYMNRTGTYVPTWLPDGYQRELDTWEHDAKPDIGSRIQTFADPANPQRSIWFEYNQIPYRGTMTFSDLSEGTYTKETVDIGGIQGDLYITNDGSSIGTLIWIDTEISMMFVMHFSAEDTETALRVARSVTYVEQG